MPYAGAGHEDARSRPAAGASSWGEDRGSRSGAVEIEFDEQDSSFISSGVGG